MSRALHLSRNIVIIDDNGSITMDFGGAKLQNIMDDNSPESIVKKQCLDEVKINVAKLDKMLNDEVNEIKDKLDTIFKTQQNIKETIEHLRTFNDNVTNKYLEISNIIKDEKCKNTDMTTKIDLMFTHLNNVTDEVNVVNNNINKMLYYFFNSFEVPDYRKPPNKN